MSHLSEKARKLKYSLVKDGLKTEIIPAAATWFISLPFFDQNQKFDFDLLTKNINSFLEEIDEQSTVTILTSPFYASYLLSKLNPSTHLKVWFGVRIEGIKQKEGQLIRSHAALLTITKYPNGLRHTKTRIGYTFCPYCNKTTKDYGGKKHLYHEYGTLMSDVWRDIVLNYYGDLKVLIDRLKDVFGIEGYKYLYHIDLREEKLRLQKTNNNSDVAINKMPFRGSKLIKGDCLKELKNIPTNSIDFCFADPPYNIKKKYESWDDGIDIKEYFEWCDKWITELARVIKPHRTVALLNIPQWSVRYFQHLINLLNYQDWIIWEALGLPVRMIMPAHYTVLCFSKGEPRKLPGISRENNSELELLSLESYKQDYCTRISCVKERKKIGIKDKEFISNLWWDIHRLKHNSRRVDHPTQLPPMFMHRLISLFTNEREIVLDPFNGVGTTSLCSDQLNRRFIGIELSEYYHNISVERHNELENGIDPFRINGDVPKAKNSYVKRLKKQKYDIDKKTLQLEVKEIASKIGRKPTYEDIKKYTKYKIEYFENYFINWSEVTAAVRSTGMAQVENKSDYNLFLNGNKK